MINKKIKILFFSVLIVINNLTAGDLSIATNTFSCQCSTDLSNAFSGFQEHITTDNLEPFYDNLSPLIDSIEANINEEKEKEKELRDRNRLIVDKTTIAVNMLFEVNKTLLMLKEN